MITSFCRCAIEQNWMSKMLVKARDWFNILLIWNPQTPAQQWIMERKAWLQGKPRILQKVSSVGHIRVLNCIEKTFKKFLCRSAYLIFFKGWFCAGYNCEKDGGHGNVTETYTESNCVDTLLTPWQNVRSSTMVESSIENQEQLFDWHTDTATLLWSWLCLMFVFHLNYI